MEFKFRKLVDSQKQDIKKAQGFLRISQEMSIFNVPI